MTDNGGATASASSSATVGLPPNKPPVANPGGPYTGNAGDPVQFNGSGSSDPDGTITSYTWSFGDGTSGSGSTPTHVYASAATYPVTLTVTDDDGASTSASTSATVRPANSLPVANPGGPYTGTAGQPVQFDGSASSDSDGTIAGYAWDFGDGSTGAGPSPSHTYVAAAGYTASLTVTDNAGGTNTATVEVSIAAPASALVVSPSSLSFTMPSGGSNPPAQTVGLSSTAGSLSWQATSSQPWLVLGASAGTTPASLGVSVSGTGLSEGTRTGTITITADGATNGPLVISVEFVVQPGSGQGCLAGAWYCEPFDELSNGGLSGRAGWLTSDFSIATAQVVPDPRGTGKVLLFDPPVDDIINEGVNFADQPIEGSEISVQVMTLGTQPDDKQIAKIEFITLPGHAWGKTTRTFGAIRFGNGISLQYGPNITQTLVDTVDSNRWYALKVLYSSGAVYAYVDGVLRFSAPSYLESWLPVQGFGTTGWDFPGQGYLDVIQGRPAGPEVSNTPSGPAQVAEARVGSSGGIIALMLAGCLGFVSRSSRRRGWARFLTAVAIVLLLPALSVAAETVRYYHLDAVGNVRAVSDQAGQVVERHDYLPFGEELNPTGGNQPKRFTGKERDAETGLDYFGARYYGSKIGRFTTTDPVYNWKENLVDPQRWNRYAYGRNNPFRFADPDGRDPKDIARGAGKGVAFGAVDFGIGLFGLLDDPGSIVTGPIEAVFVAGQAYFTSEGRAQLAGQFGALDQEGKTTVITEALTLGGIGAAIGRLGKEGPGPYADIPDAPSVGPGKLYTHSQKAKIYAANRARNGGALRSDCSGCELTPSEQSMKGVPTPDNAAQIDHDTPRSQGGPNSFANARVLSAKENRVKGAN